eukprot:gnl/TRDRNA2_/TRDRNA2_185883_c0_seq1.p1 gnl/TRDRNA2_/TRDRNA2_185883_c0~~gnl/TRDRNA2_/TRDRNA2_185883_c0_seq1.p1  ORF type:complete len:127 (-),score=12.89 gnl/TRDRNA2_/TRDRNA2_185883_c0_seq1:130-510(-)
MNRAACASCIFLLLLGLAESTLRWNGRNLLSCSRDLSGVTAAGKAGVDFNFICDKTNPWLHFDGSSWAPATPPLGCHEYVFLQGTPPSDCAVGQACEACANPQGIPKYTLKLSPDGGACATCQTTI